MTYQKVTGTLSPGGHCGSYNGQDAYNDMLVVDAYENILASSVRDVQGIKSSLKPQTAGLQGCDRYCHCEGGGEVASVDCRNQGFVRRLTPREAERLQGFPDGWVDIGEWTDTHGKKHRPTDTPKYKALGNAICLPFWQWLARRICAQYERDITMGGLFSGIGGFEYVFKRCGAEVMFSSEIEEFPIAVLKKHFGDDETGEIGDFWEYADRRTCRMKHKREKDEEG